MPVSSRKVTERWRRISERMAMNNELTWWAGEGGNAYMLRNEPSQAEVGARAASLERVLPHCTCERQCALSILEVGAGPGANLQALHMSMPRSKLYAVEPNETARKQLEQLSYVQVFDG